jgi:hypothetical protein
MGSEVRRQSLFNECEPACDRGRCENAPSDIRIHADLRSVSHERSELALPVWITWLRATLGGLLS